MLGDACIVYVRSPTDQPYAHLYLFCTCKLRPDDSHQGVFYSLGLEEAHRDLKISPEEFDEVAAELGRSLDFAKVPAREKGEVLAAFAARKKEVTAGYKTN